MATLSFSALNVTDDTRQSVERRTLGSLVFPDATPFLTRVLSATTSASGTDTASRSITLGTTHIMVGLKSTTGTITQGSFRLTSLDSVEIPIPPLEAGGAWLSELIPVVQQGIRGSFSTNSIATLRVSTGTISTAASTILVYLFAPRCICSQ